MCFIGLVEGSSLNTQTNLYIYIYISSHHKIWTNSKLSVIKLFRGAFVTKLNKKNTKFNQISTAAET